MPKPSGRRNNSTIVREYLHKKFADLAESKDIDEMLLAVIEKAKEGNLMASRIVLDNMDKIVQWEQKQEEGHGGIEIVIARDGVEVKKRTKDETDFKPELFFEWNGTHMSLADICRTERLPYKRVWDQIQYIGKDYDSIEDAVQFVKDTEVLDG